MLKAVAQGKAHWLFDRVTTHGTDLKRRPQEDLVTSAVFGSLDLLDEAAKRRALKLLLGHKAWQEFNPPECNQVKIELWPQGMRIDGGRVEPDVLLHAGDKIAIVEVKWYAPLSPDQLDKEIRAVRSFYPGKNVLAILLLGDATLPFDFSPDRIFSNARSWRDVARDVARAVANPTDSPGQWADMIMGFLRKTEFGRIFHGFGDQHCYPVGSGSYCFRADGDPPWLNQKMISVQDDHYKWKGKMKC